FSGTIMQFRIGRTNATDTYLDILASDGDRGFNFGMCTRSWPAGSTYADQMAYAAQQMGLDLNITADLTGVNPTKLPRGRVGFGLGRDLMQSAADSAGATWSIQNGTIQVIPLRGYLPGDAVVLNFLTGMIGLPEQTDEGINVRSLLNPKLRIGGL